jgi:glucokinase
MTPGSARTPDAATNVVIGIDVGGTTISGGLVTHAGDTLATVQTPTHRAGRGTAVHTLFEVLDDLVHRGSDLGLTIDGIGVGLPSLVDVERGVLFGSVSMVPELFEFPLTERIASHTGVPAFADNDVNALALGQWLFGLGQGASSLVVLALGTGVGGGVVVGDTLLRGHRSCGGELGHVVVDFHGRLCVCGGRGCLCMYVSGHMLALEARQIAGVDRNSKLLALAGGDARAITAELVFQAAAAGDRVARGLVEDACDALAAGLGIIVNGFNPEVVVVTGGVAGSLAPMETEILRRAARYCLPPAFASTRIHVVPGGKEETVRGGAALVLYELRRRRTHIAS